MASLNKLGQNNAPPEYLQNMVDLEALNDGRHNNTTKITAASKLRNWPRNHQIKNFALSL